MKCCHFLIWNWPRNETSSHEASCIQVHYLRLIQFFIKRCIDSTQLTHVTWLLKDSLFVLFKCCSTLSNGVSSLWVSPARRCVMCYSGSACCHSVERKWFCCKINPVKFVSIRVNRLLSGLWAFYEMVENFGFYISAISCISCKWKDGKW